MSPQSTLCERASFSGDNNSCDRFAYFTELVQAADESFSTDWRIDTQQDHPVLESCTNPYQLKKRKVSIYSSSSPSEETHFQYSTDFLSAIFQDIADIISAKENHIEPCLSHTASNKKHRVSVATSISRCSKSYACLSCSSSSFVDQDRPSSTDVNSVGLDSKNLLSVEGLDERSFVSANLPATISENSCSVVNLTQTSVRAAQVHETPSNFFYGFTSQNKDSYGWFVEIDDVPEECPKTEHTPRVPNHKTKDGLSFAANTARQKSPVYDAAVEWAKAADTVDNVLGDLPF